MCIKTGLSYYRKYVNAHCAQRTDCRPCLPNIRTTEELYVVYSKPFTDQTHLSWVKMYFFFLTSFVCLPFLTFRKARRFRLTAWAVNNPMLLIWSNVFVHLSLLTSVLGAGRNFGFFNHFCETCKIKRTSNSKRCGGE